MALTGDFKGMQRLESNLARLAEVPSAAAKEAAQEITTALQQEFASGNDPYGKSWVALKPSTIKSGRTPPPLTDTGKLRDGTEARPMQGAGISVVVGAPYGRYHQSGTKTMVARPILPYAGLPAKWTAAIRNAVNKAFTKRMK